MTASLVSSRRTAAATGVVAAIVTGLAAVAIVGSGGQPQPAQLPAGERPSPPATTPTPTSQAEADDEPPEARAQRHVPIGDDQLAAAIDRAEAWVAEMLTWRYTESAEQRRQRLATHLTDQRAADHQGGHGTAELARRREVEWTATGEVTHSYPETIRDGLVVVVVMATEHITTVEGERREQHALTVEVVPTDDGWRVDGMVF